MKANYMIHYNCYDMNTHEAINKINSLIHVLLQVDDNFLIDLTKQTINKELNNFGLELHLIRMSGEDIDIFIGKLGESEFNKVESKVEIDKEDIFW